jgi:hypothetical protein
MMIAGNTLQVWNVPEKRQHASLAIESLEISKVEQPQGRNWYQVKRFADTIFSVSQDKQYLAFSWGYVLNVFDLRTMQLIGQASSLGSPQFMPDGMLATIEHRYRPLKPVTSLFSIQNGQLVRLKEDFIPEPNPHLVIADNSTTYLTSQPGADRQPLPEWIPTWLSEKLTEWLSLSDRRWVLTLRSQWTGKEILIKTIQQKVEKLPVRAICGGFLSSMDQDLKESYVEAPLFNVLISPDQCWLAKQDDHFIELWPLLTYWRPWYCWLTVAGLGLLGCYVGWHCRRAVAGR